MKRMRAEFVLTVLILTLVWSSGWAQPDELGRPQGRLPVSVLLLVPERFDHYVYSSFHRGTEVWHRFGREAADRMRLVLGPEFENFEMRFVRQEPNLQRMLDPEDPEYLETRQFDFIAIPSFGDIRSWSKGREYGIEVNLVLEFHSTSGQRVSTIKGYAESSTGFLTGISPGEAGSRALAAAVGAVRNRIAKSPELFRP